MTKAKKERPANYEERVKLAESVKFEDLVRVAAPALSSPK